MARITIFSGHYGSGKTTLAVNEAILQKKSGYNVTLIDLDTVNPYFRTKDSADILNELNIPLISSAYANTNVDVPAIPAAANGAIEGQSNVVIDVGGDSAGAIVLGRYAGYLMLGGYDMLLVANKYRPLSRNINDALTIISEIEESSRLKFTGICSNPNLGHETTAGDVISGLDYAEELSKASGLLIKSVTCERKLFKELSKQVENITPVDIYDKKEWRIY